jgi:predicted DNA-binding WGR domain protein
MSLSYSKYLVSTSTSGGKYWEVEVEGTDVRIRYGKLGAERPWSTKSYETEEKAIKEAEKTANSKLRKGYSEAPRPSEISDESVDLSKTPLRGVFYFRALDRYPGGNADMFTIKITVDMSPGEDPKIKAARHSNWDGEHFTTAETEFEMPGLKENTAKLVGAAQSLTDAGQREGDFIIDEPRYDDEEYDTEWSFLEFTLYKNESASESKDPVLLKVVQRAIPKAPKVSPPDETFAAFIEAVHTLCGIGRVENTSESGDAFSAAFNKSSENISHGYKDGEIPLYL